MNKQNWITKCQEWRNKWSIFLPEYEDDSKGLNLYKFMQVLNDNLKEDSIIVSDSGSGIYVPGQALQFKSNKGKFINSGAQSEMGFCLGASIGACLANNKKEVIVLVGDGSFQFNIQELATIKYHKLPIKIFVWNNEGYLSIRNTQNKFYEGRLLGTGPEAGLWFPELNKIAKAYEMQYKIINNIKYMDLFIKEVMEFNGPVICEVICQKNQEIIPAITASKDKDGKLVQNDFCNMYPFIKDIEKEMIN